MRKPGILKVVPFDAESLLGVEYLQHQGDDAPSVFKKGDIISVGQWQKEHESKERFWKQWWKPIRFCIVQENEKVIVAHEQIKGIPRDILGNGGKCMIEWEENQCDGCRAGIPLIDSQGIITPTEKYGIHRKINDRTDLFGIGCTAERYDRPKLINGKATIYSV